MNCKDCARTQCRDKNKPPAKCERFLRYDETAKFAAYDKMMRENKGVVLPEK